MDAKSMDLQHGAVITRDAHVALRDLKELVDLVTNEMREAEFESVDAAIGRTQPEASRQKLMAAAETLRSPRFEAVVQRALTKLEMALAWHAPKQKAAHSS